ncbi:MAG: glycosyltransferase family 4 protein [Candidatus Rehaiarchaeum fermentans]|nr:glycosyltransferase family 4 protein [Candidatus Rehaiarchaeum fermentans]
MKSDKGSVVILRSNPIAPDPRVEKEAISLSNNGYEVSILCWDRENKFPSVEEKEFGTIYRLQIPAKFGTGIKNITHLIRWQFGLLKWLCKNRKSYYLIHACDFDTVIPALVCKLFFKKRVIYDIFDFYADMLRNVPNTLKKLIRFIDLKLINHVDAVILADESRIIQIKGSQPKRVIVVYNAPRNDFDCKNNISNKSKSLTVGYIGLLQKERGIFEMINVISKHEEWKLVIGGFGSDEEYVKSMCTRLKNAEFVGRVPYDETLKIYCGSDVLFATYDPRIPNHRYSSANKLFEAMMLGKPIIVAKNTGMDNLVKKYNLGYVVDYGDEYQLENALSEIYNWSSEKRLDFAKRVKDVYLKEFSWANMEKRLLNLYGELNKK